MSKITRVLEVQLGNNSFNLTIEDRALTLSYAGSTHRLTQVEKEEITHFLICSGSQFDDAEQEGEG